MIVVRERADTLPVPAASAHLFGKAFKPAGLTVHEAGRVIQQVDNAALHTPIELTTEANERTLAHLGAVALDHIQFKAALGMTARAAQQRQ
jgi:hypothetical protein